ncbi:carbohydrate ABC transporter substrate-binding protein (CUT1 family) [Pseudoxanthomonas sp. 3HH-4]|uniref:sugar ABC transporter substrate-binding protein n=1 Tax=Pseudoxanthomonas sp. 3HH-4 TaxID=1690214 RepID=UPI0011739306|nr:sugar ABC transporter substrate-binding protein [Pseudoxanthomonas sp. 3HH-4]TQM12474.1 carbohydrate ABC transporter substrate-binding protein (CUT1 family) [Pseudoxanthomonas sp. 3HH-4]
MRCCSFLILLSVLAIAGCARTQDDRTVVRFWVMGYEGEVVARLLPEFERQHPDIHVDLQIVPWLSAHEKLLTAFAGESLPDVSPIGNTWIPEFAALGALEPLDDEIAATSGFDREDFFPGVWDTGVIDGRAYAVPWYVETRLPFYRRDMLAKAGVETLPASWDQWRIAMQQVKQVAGQGNYSILLPLNEFEPLLSLAIQQPEPLLRDGGRYGNFRSAGFRQSLGFYKEMFEQGWAPIVTNNQISNVWDEFGKGFYSFYISGPWNIAKFKERLPASQQDDWMTMPLPGPNGPGASLANGTSFVVFKDSPNKAAAWELIAWLSSPSVQAEFHALTGDLPPRRSPWQTPALAKDPYARAFREQLERAVSTPKVPEWERIATEMRLVGEQVANGRMTVDQAAEELDRRADRILEKRRWMLDHAVKPGVAP